MTMQDAEAQRQIQQMVNFIMNEARDKAQEIEAKALEDFNIEKLKLEQQMKNKVCQEYQQKAKLMVTQRAIARSTAVNKSRLKKIGARNAVVEELVQSTLLQLARLAVDAPGRYQALCTDLMTQGALMFLEEELLVCCRPEDESMIRSAIPAAEKAFSDIIQSDVGVSMRVRLAIDRDHPLPSGPSSDRDTFNSCSGGVKLTSPDGKVIVDNTLDARLQIVMNKCLPQVRKLLFPVH